MAAIFLSSAISRENNLEIGSKAPEITFQDGKKEVAIKGNLKLVNFWNPKNPSSRINNKNFTNYFKNNPESNIEYITICTDSDELLAQEVMKNDGTALFGSHFYQKDINERVLKDYGVESNPRSFLIDADGKIIAINPTDL